MEISKYFYSLLISSFSLIFIGIVSRISEEIYLSSYSNLFIFSGITLLFITSTIPLLVIVKDYLKNAEELKGLKERGYYFNPIDVLFLGISILIYVIYRDIMLSIAIFMILYGINRIFFEKEE